MLNHLWNLNILPVITSHLSTTAQHIEEEIANQYQWGHSIGLIHGILILHGILIIQYMEDYGGISLSTIHL